MRRSFERPIAMSGGILNGTLAPYTFSSGSFPHYKSVLMPPDQRDKILAMHAASKETAGIYVAVVLIMYVILLTILLCRYRSRLPFYLPEVYHHHQHHEPSLPSQTYWWSPLWNIFCECDCCKSTEENKNNGGESSPEEVGDVPMTTMAMTLVPRPPTTTTNNRIPPSSSSTNVNVNVDPNKIIIKPNINLTVPDFGVKKSNKPIAV